MMHNVILSEVSLSHELSTPDFVRKDAVMEQNCESIAPPKASNNPRVEQRRTGSRQAGAKFLASQYTKGIVGDPQSI